jgi:hypothetical protein
LIRNNEKPYQILKDSFFKKSITEGFILSKWRLSNRIKGQEEIPLEVQMTTEHISELEEKSQEIPINVYDETLYSKGFIQKQPVATLPEKKQPLKRSSWECLSTIEHKIDHMERKQTEILKTGNQTSVNTNKKVDNILSKKTVRG